MIPQGEALAAEFGLAETYPKANVGYSVLALPTDADLASATQEMHKLLLEYSAHGVPAELVDAPKRGEIASVEFDRRKNYGCRAL